MNRALLAGLLGAALALAGCGGGGDAGGGTRLSIATGGTSGVYYVYGGGLAKLINGNLEGVSAATSTTSGSVDNIRAITSGKADIAFSLADTAADAATGKESFTAPQPIRALARIYDNYTQLVAAKGAKVSRVADLKGKRVGIGAANSGTLVIALRMLAAAGVAVSDIGARQLGINESVQAMKDGRLDAFFWSGGVPTAGLTDLTRTRKDVMLVDTSDLLPALTGKYGNFYRPLTVPGGAYALPGDVKTVGVANFLLVGARMSDDLAYKLTKLLFDKKADLVRVHPEAGNLDKRVGRQVDPLQLHPGAQKFFAGQ